MCIHTKGTKSAFTVERNNSKGNIGVGKGPECWNGHRIHYMVQVLNKTYSYDLLTVAFISSLLLSNNLN
jgi:hypothetical protein